LIRPLLWKSITGGHSHYGPWSWSPAGVVLVVGIILLLTGHVRFG
jgi:hypothetical protein